MKFDSYPRFLKSDVYRQSLVAEMERGHLPCEDGEEEREMKSRGSFFWKVHHSAVVFMVAAVYVINSVNNIKLSCYSLSLMLHHSFFGNLPLYPFFLGFWLSVRLVQV